MKARRVIGFGDNVVDRYTNQRVMFPGGNAVNVAVYAKKMGMDAAYLGVFANDFMGDHIKHALNDVGVVIDHCITKEGVSGYCDVILEDGNRIFQEWNEGGISVKEPIIVGDLLLVLAAVVSGGVFGSHACFFSDATVLSSATCEIDNLSHAVTQIPYAMISAVLAIIGFVVAGYVMC